MYIKRDTKQKSIFFLGNIKIDKGEIVEINKYLDIHFHSKRIINHSILKRSCERKKERKK